MRLWTLDSGPDNIFDTLCLRVETKASECALHVSRFGDRRNPSARKGCPRHCSDQIQRFNPHLCCCWAPIAGIPGPPCGRHGWWTALESQWTRRPASNPAPRRSPPPRAGAMAPCALSHSAQHLLSIHLGQLHLLLPVPVPQGAACAFHELEYLFTIASHTVPLYLFRCSQ